MSHDANRSNPSGNLPVLAPSKQFQDFTKYSLAQFWTSDKSEGMVMFLYPHWTDRSALPSDRDLLYWSVAFDGPQLFAACLMQCSNLAKAGDSIEIRETGDALTMSSERLGSYGVSAQRCFGNINTHGENPLGAIMVLGFATDFPGDVVVARSNGVALTRAEIKDTRAKLMQRYAQPERESILEPVPVGELGVERTASAFVLAPSR